MISDFYPGTTKRFSVTLTLNGEQVNVVSDSVTWTIKRRKTDPDTSALLVVEGDVSQGATGQVTFIATDEETADLLPGRYECDIKWERSNGEEYVVHSQMITVKERVSDV